MKAIVLGTLAAIGIQPIVFIAGLLPSFLMSGESVTRSGLFGLSIFAAIFAIPFVLVVGIPALLLLRKFHRLSWHTISVVGFLGAALPIAVLSWPAGRYGGYSSAGNWHGHYVTFFVNGVPTFYGWLSYALSSLEFGVHGLIGALAFYWVWLHVAHTSDRHMDYPEMQADQH